MAEFEIGIMSRQALGKPLPDLKSFKEQVRIWTIKRNAEHTKINWQFKTQDYTLNYLLLKWYFSMKNCTKKDLKSS